MSIEITSPVRQRPADGGALVSNDGTLQADGGRISLTAAAADGIVQNLVRAGGRISANTDAATGRRGEVVIAGTGGAVIIEGQVDARGLAAGQRGGTIEVVADRVLAAAGARIDASGTAGGGEIAFGQTRQGSATPRRAERTGVAAGAELRADATVLGQGGRIVLHSTEATAMDGRLSARGGPQGGDGGFIEVSGGHGLRVTGSMDAGAPAGNAGTVLIDPVSLTITDAPDPDPGDDNAYITPGSITGTSGALILQADTLINVNAFINKPTGDLTLNSGGDINVNQGIFTNSGGSLTLLAGGNITLFQQLRVDNALTMNAAGSIVTNTAAIDGNAISMVAGGSISVGARVVAAGTLTMNASGDILITNPSGGTFSSSGPMSLTAGGNLQSIRQMQTAAGDMTLGATAGNVVLNGQTVAAGALGISAGGNIAINASAFGDQFRIVAGGDFSLPNNANVAVIASGAGTAPGAVTGLLAAGGSIRLGVLSEVRGNGLRILAAYDPTTDGVDLTRPGSLSIGGLVNGYTGGNLSNGVWTNPVQLGAGTGGITQSGFPTQITADTLNVVSGGDAIFGSPLFIRTLGASNVRGNLSLTLDYLLVSGSPAVPANVTGEIRVGGIFDLLERTNGITQAAGSSIITPRLNVSTEGTGASVALLGNNLIDELGPVSANGDITIRNVTNLTVAGTVTGGGVGLDTVSIAVDGPGASLMVTGAIAAGNGLFSLTAAGDVTIATGASVTSTNAGQTGSAIGAGVQGGSPIPGSTATLRLAGTVGMAGGLTLASGTGGIQQTGGSVSAGRLILLPGGDVRLDGGVNAIATLAAVDVPGALRIVNGATDLTIGEAVTANIIELTTQGTLLVQPGSTFAGGFLEAAERISLRANGLDLPPASFPPGLTVRAPVVEIAPAAPRPMQVALSAAGTAIPNALMLADLEIGQIGATDTLRFGATSIGGAITATATQLEISGNLDFAGGPTLEVGRLDLRSLGDITQLNGTLLGADILAGQAGSAVTLPNVSLGYLDDLSAGGDIVLSIGSLLRLRGTLSTPGTATLSTPNGIEATGAGRASVGELRVSAVEGSVLLAGQNAIGRLGESSIFGDLVLVNTGPSLTIPSGSLVEVGGIGTVTATAGSITVDGTIRASELSLSAPAGTVAVNGFSAIAFAGGLALSGQTVTVNGLIAGTSGITVDASQSASLAGIAQTPSLSITSPSISFGGLDASSSSVALFLGGSGSASGALTAATLRVTDGASAVLTGSITGDTTGTAAALGRRFAGGTQLGDPPPNQFDYLFNDCPLAASVCARPEPPVPPIPPTELPVTPPIELPFTLPNETPSSFDVPAFTVADNPRGLMGGLIPAEQPPSNPLVRIPVLPFVTQSGRDTSEDRELAPPNIRAEDF
nr:hypothetical protein [Plastoroseomonas hellenica]